jgi:hypothetical protein
MKNITVGRYPRGFTDGVPNAGEFWQGWVEPDDLSWVVFVRRDGTPVVFLNRDPKTGAVINDP